MIYEGDRVVLLHTDGTCKAGDEGVATEVRVNHRQRQTWITVKFDRDGHTTNFTERELGALADWEEHHAVPVNGELQPSDSFFSTGAFQCSCGLPACARFIGKFVTANKTEKASA